MKSRFAHLPQQSDLTVREAMNRLFDGFRAVRIVAPVIDQMADEDIPKFCDLIRDAAVTLVRQAEGAEVMGKTEADKVAGLLSPLAMRRFRESGGDWQQTREFLNQLVERYPRLRRLPAPEPVPWSSGDTGTDLNLKRMQLVLACYESLLDLEPLVNAEAGARRLAQVVIADCQAATRAIRSQVGEGDPDIVERTLLSHAIGLVKNSIATRGMDLYRAIVEDDLALDQKRRLLQQLRSLTPVIEAWRHGFHLALKLGFGQELAISSKPQHKGPGL